jgi:alpha-tubulin suppressor-like RCC1 family protein
VDTGVSKASAGLRFSAYRKTDGTLLTMGNNSYGQLGDGTVANRNSPGQVASNVTDFSTGTDHLVILVPAAP